MRTWSYMPSLKDWLLEAHRDRAKEVSMCLTDPVIADLVWEHYWNDYLEAIAGIGGCLFLIETMSAGEDESTC